MGDTKPWRQVFGAAFAVLCTGVTISSVSAEAVNFGTSADPVTWLSRDGRASYQLDGDAAQAMNCFASSLAYAEESRAFTAEHLHAEMQQTDALRIAEWQQAIGLLLGPAAVDYPPEELLHGAEFLKEDWRALAKNMALASVMDFAQGQIPAEIQLAFDHYGNCNTLLYRLLGEQ